MSTLSCIPLRSSITEWNFFYPFSNTSMRDLCSSSASSGGQQPTRALLLGCSDLSSIAHTFHLNRTSLPDSAWSRTPLHAVACDVEPGAVARSLVLLQLLADLPSCSVTDVTRIWEIVYSTFITPDVADTLQRVLQRLCQQLEEPDAWQRGPLAAFGVRLTGDVHAVKKLLRWWNDQLQDEEFRSEATLARVRRVQTLYRKLHNAEATRTNLNLLLLSKPLGANAKEVEFLDSYLVNGFLSLRSVCGEDRSSQADLLSPSAAARRGVLNPTFLPDIINLAKVFDNVSDNCSSNEMGSVWRVHYLCHPIDCLRFESLMAMIDHPPSAQMRFLRSSRSTSLSIIEACFELFGRRVDALGASLRSGIHRIILHCGDAFALCDALREEPLSWLPSEMEQTRALAASLQEAGAPKHFDIIDTSNIGDYSTVLPLLLAATPLLAPVAENPRATLATDLMKVKGRDQDERLTDALKPVPLWLLPFAVGVALDSASSVQHRDSAARRDPSSLWTSYPAPVEQQILQSSMNLPRGFYHLRWRRCLTASVPLRVADSQSLQDLLYDCLEYAVQISSTSWGLPTFARLLHSMATSHSFSHFRSDIERLFSFEALENKFSSNFFSLVPANAQSLLCLLRLHGIFGGGGYDQAKEILELKFKLPDDWKLRLISHLSTFFGLSSFSSFMRCLRVFLFSKSPVLWFASLCQNRLCITVHKHSL